MATHRSKNNPLLTADFLVAPNAEDQTFERKSARIEPAKLAEALVALANADGGTVAVGITDRKFEDLEQFGTKRINELKQVAINFTQPPVRVIPEEMEVPTPDGTVAKILLLHVEQQSDHIHATVKDEVFLRVGDMSRRLRFEERLQLEYDRGLREYEIQEVPECTTDDLDMDLVDQWAHRLGHVGDPHRLLAARGLMSPTTGVLRVAGVLLFAQNPTAFFPNARLRFIRYDGHKAETGSRMNVTKEFIVDGPLPRMIPAATDIITAQLRSFSALNPRTGTFESVAEYPEFAWQEGIVNAITHRAYNMQGADIQVRMFDDRLEIESPGRLPGLVRLTNIKDVRFSRNPRIAQVLNAFGYVKEFGEGVNRIYEEMRLFHLDDPAYAETSSYVRLTLKNNIVMRRIRRIARIGSLVSEDLWDTLTDQERQALEFAYTQHRVYTKDFAERLERSRHVARKVLEGLVEKGLLEDVATAPTDPRRHYRLAVDEEGGEKDS